MSDDRSKQPPAMDADIEREIREGRKFSAKEAVARLAGPGAMKGASPVSRLQQAQLDVGSWLKSNVEDGTGALPAVLHRHVSDSELLLESPDQPQAALAGYCQQLLSSEYLIKELVREADVEWGRRMDERPHFDREGSPPHPGDPYTVESLRHALSEILGKLDNSKT